MFTKLSNERLHTARTMKLTNNIISTSFLFLNMFSMGQVGSSSSSSRKETCVKHWEWTIEDASMVTDEKEYFGFQLDNSIGTYKLPVYDNIDLQGEPVARLRGSMISDATIPAALPPTAHCTFTRRMLIWGFTCRTVLIPCSRKTSSMVLRLEARANTRI